MIDFNVYQRIVIKIGSALLVKNQEISLKWLQCLADNIIDLKKQHKQIVIVTSGAVALGKSLLKIIQPEISISQKQALASVGQIKLMSHYQQVFTKHQQQVAQILVTANDCNTRNSYLNCSNTIATLLENNIIPIINENDSIATQEIKFGDNDRLAARIAQMINADLLILFSDIDGLYNKNPKINADATLIKQVAQITSEIEAMATGTSSQVGTGGMITKIMAAKMAMQSQCSTIITNGESAGCLQKLWQQQQPFTHFVANEKLKKDHKKSKSKTNWLTGIINPKGEIIINDCAVTALKKGGASLLAIGAIAVNGNFFAQDPVLIKDSNKQIIASGIVNHSSADVAKILQKTSQQIKEILGDNCKTELIHIDNLVLQK
ncbi:MAG: glutamate 5-kinase [Proteobacteria bacterium]|nr:glutamate 5-kinase [Pseudomonadota bacterium]